MDLDGEVLSWEGDVLKWEVAARGDAHALFGCEAFMFLMSGIDVEARNDGTGGTSATGDSLAVKGLSTSSVVKVDKPSDSLGLERKLLPDFGGSGAEPLRTGSYAWAFRVSKAGGRRVCDGVFRVVSGSFSVCALPFARNSFERLLRIEISVDGAETCIVDFESGGPSGDWARGRGDRGPEAGGTGRRWPLGCGGGPLRGLRPSL